MSLRLKITLVVCLIAAAYVAGTLTNRPPGRAADMAAAGSRPILHWACPMHPEYKSDRAGDAPCCGMRLEPVYDGGAAPAASEAAGTVRVSPQQQQLIGVRTEEVRSSGGTHELRLAGRVASDESRLHRIVAASDGWIRALHESSVGAVVRRGQVLAAYYTPTLLNAQQNLLFALTTGDAPRRASVALGSQRVPGSLTVQSAIDGLRDLGMDELQIAEIRRTQQYAQEINIYSPIEGVVVARNISPDQRFEKGAELYRIADLNHLWVVADVFEADREFVRPGAAARVRYGSREIPARMSAVLPQFDAQTRTLKTRFEVDNRGLLLRPDMFVTVEIGTKLAGGISVPVDAVMENGRHSFVFVAKGEGVFEPRMITTGWRAGGRAEVRSGLQPGEHIVVSGNFLIDSERRMRTGSAVLAPVAHPQDKAAAGSDTAVKDVICGMNVNPNAAGVLKLAAAGTTYYFCSEQCRRTFAADPSKYSGKKHL